MSVRLRRAGPADLEAIVALRDELRLVPGRSGGRGGFLLGCSPDRYGWLIGCASVTLLESEGALAGFAVTLPDPVLRASELWARRGAIGWRAGEAEPPADETIGYFDQLALARGASRLHAAPLALEALRGLADAGHDHLYATTLAAPVCNSASLRLLGACGARIVGHVAEHYQGIGDVVSWLHHVRIPDALARVSDRAAGVRAALAADRLAA